MYKYGTAKRSVEPCFDSDTKCLDHRGYPSCCDRHRSSFDVVEVEMQKR